MVPPARTFLTATAAALLVAGCAVNPATGKRELSLIGTQQEINMGREANQQVQGQIGLVNDQALQSFVDSLGQEIAARTERPDLPWTFQVVDDPAVNAFALPGGFINVTRGILAYFNSEAELAGVLGHEIGHVTARHSVNQMSKQQLQQLGLAVGMVVSENVRQYSDLFAVGLGLLNLKYSRDDETQADELGLRYMSADGFDADAMVGVFKMLEVVSGAAEGRMPEWQSTHPYPENREEHIRALMQQQGITGGGRVDRDAYLQRVDGLVYGENPREGYFRDQLFLQPEMAFQLRFPDGWKTVNQRNAVGAVTESQDALVVLQVAPDSLGMDPEGALRTFLAQEGVRSGTRSTAPVNGVPAARASFTASNSDGTELQGEVMYVVHHGSMFQIRGYAGAGSSRYQAAISAALSSFAPVTDRAVLDVQPWRLQIVRVPSSMTLSAFHDRYATPVSVEELARLNRMDADANIPAGTRVKRVVGQPLP